MTHAFLIHRQNLSTFDKPVLGSLATATVGQTSTQKHIEPMEVDIVPKARKSIRYVYINCETVNMFMCIFCLEIM